MRRKADRLSITALAISLLVAGVIGVVGFPAVLKINQLARENQDLSERIIAEGEERRDQACRLHEADHLADIQRLRRTYAYLRRLSREEWGTNLTAAIVRQLPELEREARVDSAPPFCDEPRVGLPEPDPVPPPKRDFSYLLNRQ